MHLVGWGRLKALGTIVLLVFSLLVSAAIPAHSQDRTSNETELLLAKALVEFNAGRLESAEKLFLDVVSRDAGSHVPMEYLYAIYISRDDTKKAIEWLERAREMSPRERWGTQDYQLGSLYLKQGQAAEAITAFRRMLETGSEEQQILAEYLLGYIHYVAGEFFKAEEFFQSARARFEDLKIQKLREARVKLSDVKASPGRRATLPEKLEQEERVTLQAVYFYLGEIYARLSYTRFAVAMLRKAEYGESREIRVSAWKVHSDVNRSRHYLLLGTAAQVDSNVGVDQLYTDVSVSTSGTFANAALFTLNGGWQSSPARDFSYGFDGAGLLSRPTPEIPAIYGKGQLALGAWIDYWDQRETSLTIRYEVGKLYLGTGPFESFQSSHGPRVTLSYFPDQRWTWEIGAYFRSNGFAGSQIGTSPIYEAEKRTGDALGGIIRASLRSVNPKIKPTFGYTIENTSARSARYGYLSNAVNVGLDFALLPRLNLSAGLGGGLIRFPTAVPSRFDRMLRSGAMVQYTLSPHWIVMADVAEIINISTDPDFTYGRLRSALGVRYAF